MKTVEIYVDPMGKPRMTQKDCYRAKHKKYWDYKQIIQWHNPNVDWNKPIKMVFHMPMPKSWSKKKRLEMLGKPHKKRPDGDNLEKGLTDSLFKEDAHIWNIHRIKIWDEVGKIVITELD